MARGSGQEGDKQAMLAALKILAREKGNVARLQAELPGALGKDAAAKTLGELDVRGVLAVKSSVARVPQSMQAHGDAIIRQKLAAKFVRDADIDAAIAELPSEAERATAVARKKWPTIRARDDFDRVGKLLRFLTGRGFGLEACRGAAQTVAESGIDHGELY